MIDKIIEQLEPLVKDELDRANMVHPAFHSSHEGLAAIDEEVFECQMEYENLHRDKRVLMRHVYNDEFTNADKIVRDMREKAVNLAAEAIQVAAMCDKWYQMAEKRVNCVSDGRKEKGC